MSGRTARVQRSDRGAASTAPGLVNPCIGGINVPDSTPQPFADYSEEDARELAAQDAHQAWIEAQAELAADQTASAQEGLA